MKTKSRRKLQKLKSKTATALHGAIVSLFLVNICNFVWRAYHQATATTSAWKWITQTTQTPRWVLLLLESIILALLFLLVRWYFYKIRKIKPPESYSDIRTADDYNKWLKSLSEYVDEEYEKHKHEIEPARGPYDGRRF